MGVFMRIYFTPVLALISVTSWSMQISLAENSKFHKDIQEASDKDQYEDYINFKSTQNSLPDKKRNK
jgi:hypothetical protein